VNVNQSFNSAKQQLMFARVEQKLSSILRNAKQACIKQNNGLAKWIGWSNKEEPIVWN
jgi:hypothetical protein